MKKNKTKSSGRRIFILIVAIISIAILMFITLSDVVVQIYDKYNEASELEEKLADLKDNEEKLESEINRLQDPEYLARYAREKYFYSKENELIIRIPDKEEKIN